MGLLRILVLTSIFVISTSITAPSGELGVEDTLYQLSFQQLLQSGQLDLDFQPENDGDSLGAWSPWTHEPICTHKLPKINSELCVYTNDRFSNGRGISILTTPKIAEEVAAIVIAYFQLNPIILAEQRLNLHPGTWTTKPVLSKGLGMFATQALTRGDTITSSTPVLLIYKETVLPKHEREKFLQLAVSQLPAITQQSYLQLSPLSANKADILAQSIASANAFDVLLSGHSHLGIFPEPSRINHDCAPNAIFVVNATQLTHTVRPTRAILPGEEITIAYTNPLDRFAQRQKYLTASFGFQCTCSRCSRGTAGDAVLDEIETLQQDLAQWANPSSDASVKQIERLIRVHEEAGLEGYLDPAFCLAALMYNSVGSSRGAVKYGKLCIEAVELRLGYGAEDLPAWREMLEQPTRHWSWMKRKAGRMMDE